MSHQSCMEYCDSLRDDLENQGYREVTPPEFELVMFKQTMRGLVPRVVAATCTLYSTDPPKVTFELFEEWSKSLLGNNGMGTLIFVYDRPPIEEVEKVLILGRGVLGYGQVVPWVYDLSSHKYWGWQPMIGTRSTDKLKFP